MKKRLLTRHLSVSVLILASGHVFSATNSNPWTFTLRNAYIHRDFDPVSVADTGSWSQSASLFYHSDLYDTPLEIADRAVKVGVDASVQYALRLSHDKHVADTVLPFDADRQSQAPDQFKRGATFKVAYDQSMLRVGELWLDLPVTSGDESRQLFSSYWGTQFKTQINDQFQLELGRLEKVSARSEEDFRQFSVTSNGIQYQSESLDYLDVRYQFLPQLKGEYYFSRLTDLYDTHYVALDHNWTYPHFSVNSKLKYFNAKQNAQQLNIDADNLGILETFKLNEHSLGVGYQQISGKSAYPLLDGFLPELYFINWNSSGFYKKNEKSYHVIYGYDFKKYIPGFNAVFKYSYGNHFRSLAGKKNNESESNLILNYDFQSASLKGFGMQYIRVDYQAKYGDDFAEDRFFVNYKKRF